MIHAALWIASVIFLGWIALAVLNLLRVGGIMATVTAWGGLREIAKGYRRGGKARSGCHAALLILVGMILMIFDATGKLGAWIALAGIGYTLVVAFRRDRSGNLGPSAHGR